MLYNWEGIALIQYAKTSFSNISLYHNIYGSSFSNFLKPLLSHSPDHTHTCTHTHAHTHTHTHKHTHTLAGMFKG